MARLNFTDLNSYDEILYVKGSAATEAGLLGTMRQRVTEIRGAKDHSKALIEQLSKENFEISDVRDGSKRQEVDNLLSSSRSTYDKARQESSMSILDWLLIRDMLNNSQDNVRKAVEVPQSEPYVPSPTLFDTSTISSSADTSGSFGGGGGFGGGSGSDGTY